MVNRLREDLRAVFDRDPAARNAREVLDMPSTMTGLMADSVCVGMTELMGELIWNFTSADHFSTVRERTDPRADALADLGLDLGAH